MVEDHSSVEFLLLLGQKLSDIRKSCLSDYGAPGDCGLCSDSYMLNNKAGYELQGGFFVLGLV